ncbi:MAG: hypothetical protein F8N15_00390 [Methanobacterium sp.]|nr:hypothetical protein [Methanobacterium sp.]
MALSAAEKDRRKEARKARDRAHSARYREVRAFEEAEEAKLTAEFGPEIDAASEAKDALSAERQAKIEAIDDKIRALQAQREAVRAAYEPLMNDARDRRPAGGDLRNARRNEVQREAARRYPDMAGGGKWSAAAWGETEYARSLLGQTSTAES